MCSIKLTSSSKQMLEQTIQQKKLALDNANRVQQSSSAVLAQVKPHQEIETLRSTVQAQAQAQEQSNQAVDQLRATLKNIEDNVIPSIKREHKKVITHLFFSMKAFR